jgi:hypothetical protein
MKALNGFILSVTFMSFAFAQTSANAGTNASTATQTTTSAASTATQANANASAAAQGGLVVPVELAKSIDSKKAKVGDEVTAKVLSDVRSSSGVAIQKGSKLIGKVTEASARSNGDATSALGIAFDRAVLKNGSTLSLVSTIQAVIAPPRPAPLASTDDTSAGGGYGAGGPASGSGPLGAAGSATGAVANTAGSAVGAVGNTAGSAVGNAAGDVTSTTNVGANAPIITAQTRGVVGIKGLELNAASQTSAYGSVLSGDGKNVKLDSGTRLLVNVSAASQ